MASQNVGEELVGAYLQHIEGCEFVAYNLHTREAQGEIDVVGINLRTKKVYLCEVAIHLVTGLQYVRGARPDNVRRLTKKFRKDVAYAKRYFRGYRKEFMLWSPVVRDSSPRAKHSQARDVEKIARQLHRSGVKLRLVANREFKAAIDALKQVALKETKELKSPVMRLFQIEAKVERRARMS